MLGGSHLTAPLRAANRAAVLILQILGIRLDIQDVTKAGIALTGTGLVRAGDRLQMWQRRIQFRVIIQLAHRLLLIRCHIEGCLQNQCIRCRLGCHELLETAVAAEQLESRIRLILQEEII